MFRPQRTTVLLAIAAEPAEKPDARLPALDSNSPLTLVSQFVSLDQRRLRRGMCDKSGEGSSRGPSRKRVPGAECAKNGCGMRQPRRTWRATANAAGTPK